MALVHEASSLESFGWRLSARLCVTCFFKNPWSLFLCSDLSILVLVLLFSIILLLTFSFFIMLIFLSVLLHSRSLSGQTDNEGQIKINNISERLENCGLKSVWGQVWDSWIWVRLLFNIPEKFTQLTAKQHKSCQMRVLRSWNNRVKKWNPE